MRFQVFHLLVHIAMVFCSSRSPQVSNDTSLFEMEEVVSVLTNMTAAQKEVFLQQGSFQDEVRSRNRQIEDEVRIRNRQIEERFAGTTAAMEQEHHLLKEIFAFLTRKIKSMSRKPRDDVAGPQGVFEQPKDCADLYLEGEMNSGPYRVWPTWLKSDSGFTVYCDMETEGGGWTVIHRWGNYTAPRDYFRRTWMEYKNGFGDLRSAFWAGNEMITALTSQGAYDLRFDMEGEDETAYSLYSNFWTENESQKYKVHFSYQRSGGSNDSAPLGDIFRSHNSAPFSTFDSINYVESTPIRSYPRPCNQAIPRRPAWWFSQDCPLQSVFDLTPGQAGSQGNRFFKTEMKIRPSDFQKMKETP